MTNKLLLTLTIIIMFSCTNTQNETEEQLKDSTSKDSIVEIEVIDTIPEINMYTEFAFAEDSLIELIRLDSSFRVDIPYATDSNFTKTTLYPCNKCVIRYKVAKALIKANNKLKERGLRLKMLDCYRPLSVQKKMWDVLPNPVYVADPYSGQASMHNRGVAVDVTIEDFSGKELEMGTGFDSFEKKAWPSYRNFPDTILANRDLLIATMDSAGFRNSRSEWWHFSLRGASFKVEDLPLPCDCADETKLETKK